MQLIGTFRSDGYRALADAAMGFFDRRVDLQRRGVAFASGDAAGAGPPAKESTDISLVAIDRSDPEAFALAEVILRGVQAGLERYLQERPLLRQCCPEQSLFVMPIFNLQRYAPGEGFHAWHCDWTTSDEATEPIRRVLAWILYCNDVPDGGTEFHWQEHHVAAERGCLAIFPAGLSHLHRGRVSTLHTKTIATGWIQAGQRQDWLQRLQAAPS
ncbi:MAG: 2OG-Fe(II) oxygenase [Synechococcaceae cyanobacterium]|nr:2OG-Fe(II) oxygenase [Synechococcaceae cyanobacterium]